MRLISNTSQRLTTFFILMISFSLIAKSSSFLRKSAFIISPYARNHSLRSRLFSSSLSDSIGTSSKHVEYLKTIANAEPPKKLETFFELLQLTDYEIIEPTERKGLIPLVIPIAKKRMAEYPVLCFMRWPTQKQGIDLQIAQTNAIGVQLIALNTENYCKRIVAELDFYGDANASKAIEIINKDGIVYTEGECLAILKSGKFPTISDKDLRLALDRYLLTVVGQFPDCYERLADNFASNENEISALVTCERAVNLFYGWGHPVRFHAEILNRMVGRETEARDAARSAMGLPVWTIAPTKIEVEKTALLAGYSDVKIVGDMHKYRSTDPRTEELGEGLTKEQVTLDQAAHLMDAVALDSVEGGWEAVKNEIANRYRVGGYPDMAVFIES